MAKVGASSGVCTHFEQSKKIQNQEKLIEFIHQFPILTAGRQTALLLTELQRTYESTGLRLPLADLLIAAQVLEHGYVLVTLDTDFRRFKEIKKEIIQAEEGTRTPE